MITEKRLDEFAEALQRCVVPTTESVVRFKEHKMTYICECTLLKLIRLARLGLWAEKHAVAALEFYRYQRHIDVDSHGMRINYTTPGKIAPPYLKSAEHGFVAREALATLPKEKE